jgi:hypothetical protein
MVYKFSDCRKCVYRNTAKNYHKHQHCLMYRDWHLMPTLVINAGLYSLFKI